MASQGASSCPVDIGTTSPSPAGEGDPVRPSQETTSESSSTMIHTSNEHADVTVEVPSEEVDDQSAVEMDLDRPDSPLPEVSIGSEHATKVSKRASPQIGENTE